MLKKYVIVTIVAGLLNLFLAAATFADSTDEKKAALADQVKVGIAKLKTGPNAKVELKLYDNSKIKGYISEAFNDYFVVIDSKTGASTEVPYPQVRQVKGNNLSEAAKIAIGVGIALGLIILLAVIVGRKG